MELRSSFILIAILILIFLPACGQISLPMPSQTVSPALPTETAEPGDNLSALPDLAISYVNITGIGDLCIAFNMGIIFADQPDLRIPRPAAPFTNKAQNMALFTYILVAKRGEFIL